MAFDDLVKKMDSVIFNRIGDGRAIIDGRYAAQVIDESQNHERLKDYEIRLNDNQRVLSLMRREVCEVRIGTKITTDKGDFVVDEVLEVDDYLVDVIVYAEG